MLADPPGSDTDSQPFCRAPCFMRLAALLFAAALAVAGCGGGKGGSSSGGGAKSIPENCATAPADDGSAQPAAEPGGAAAGQSRRAAENCGDADDSSDDDPDDATGAPAPTTNTAGAPPGGDLDPAPPGTVVVGPNLNGRWTGYFKSIEGHFEALTATIRHVGASVTIQTTKKSGVARNLSGRIDGIGRMLLYDTFDKQDWTTHYGPASGGSINLADYVFVGTSIVDTNILILKRAGGGTVNRLMLAGRSQQ